jgi:hypothetical protein
LKTKIEDIVFQRYVSEKVFRDMIKICFLLFRQEKISNQNVSWRSSEQSKERDFCEWQKNEEQS